MTSSSVIDFRLGARIKLKRSREIRTTKERSRELRTNLVDNWPQEVGALHCFLCCVIRWNKEWTCIGKRLYKLLLSIFQCALPLLLISIHTKVSKIKWKTFMRLIVKIVGHIDLAHRSVRNYLKYIVFTRWIYEISIYVVVSSRKHDRYEIQKKIGGTYIGVHRFGHRCVQNRLMHVSLAW